MKHLLWLALIVAPSLSAQQVAAPPDKVYAAAVSLFTDLGFPISLAQKDQGLLTSDDIEVLARKKLLGERSGTWLDCGKDLGVSRASTADVVTYRIAIVITGDSASSDVKIRVTGKSVQANAFGDPKAMCKSRERLEPMLLDSIAARVKGG